MAISSPGMDKCKVVEPEDVKFSVFTSKDVKQLSIMRISTPFTFDALGHPLKGGLYDLALGPINDKGDPCETCLKTIATCPGHFAHIELPIIVVNPIFHKLLFTILNISCLNCHKIQLSDKAKYLLALKLQLIDTGLVTDAMDIDNIMPELIKSPIVDVTESEVVKKYLLTLKNNKNRDDIPLEPFLNKSAYRIYDKFINDTLKAIKGKVCIHCRQPLTKITKLRNKLTHSIYTTEHNKLTKKSISMMPDSSKENLEKIWENDKELIRYIVPVLKDMRDKTIVDIFFMDVILVPPPIVRPANKMNDQLMEHPQTLSFKRIIKTGFVVRALIQVIQTEGNSEAVSDELKSVVESAKGVNILEKLHNSWQELQMNVDNLLIGDNSTEATIGLKELIEKKTGVIRSHMMGKRVNFAARSVITPDPNIDLGEIGIPDTFAKKLTYPVPVTPWNIEMVRELVINGPDNHPGATTIECENGKVISISAWSKQQREGLAMRLLTPDDKNCIKGKRITRHLNNGDILLLNRQPTLHKPSIMAHKARVLKGEKTLRLHYANCKAYNADFDGDEMNAHFPQNEIARSEAYNIINVNNQYLVPKDGTPLSGLIQDHVISGVKLSIRGKFFDKSDYQQLVFQGLSHLKKKIVLLPPTILKPQRLWSGKQVLSTLILNITPSNKVPISLSSTAKITPRAWQVLPRSWWKGGGTQFAKDLTMSESEIIIIKGELLSGVLDKNHYGATPYSLVHCFYELYGGEYSSTLLSSFAKLFTYYLQWEGFTLGVKDILVIPKANNQRANIIKECRLIGNATSADAVGLEQNTDRDALISTIENSYSTDPKFRSHLDRKYKTALDKFTNNINKACLPAGLLTKFPLNNLQLMVQSGAKGSTVNTMQISCLLGQIELEGKRPPLMISGRSLPSFPPFDTSPRAGGFIDGRFMTGIQPQEFFFHCMAGREGLIDTAVKTSKSGYLQRCLIKHLEGLSIKYDMTVRDSDDSVIQFAYGEDGMDICKVQFLNEKQLKFLDENTEAIINRESIKKLTGDDSVNKIEKYKKSIKKWDKKCKDMPKRNTPFGQFSKVMKDQIDPEIFANYFDGRDLKTCNMMEAWFKATPEEKHDYYKNYGKKCPDPIVSIMNPDHNFGAVNEKLTCLIDKYLEQRKTTELGVKFKSDPSDFKHMMWIKSMQSLAVPGEPVGLLAAQSVGEPSTQMTLNTFHFAGRGDMNVTLGIPRLREILMMASANLKTPSLEIPFRTDVENFTKKAEKLQKKFCKVTVENVLHKVDVESELVLTPNIEIAYTLEFHFLPKYMYKDMCSVTPQQILRYMEQKFFSALLNRIAKVATNKSEIVINSKNKGIYKKKNPDDDDDDDVDVIPDNGPKNCVMFNDNADSSDEEQGNDDDDGTQTQIRKRHTECQEYDDPESEEEEQSDVENTLEGELNKENEDEGFEEEDVKVDVHAIEVIDKLSQASSYTYDKDKFLWCKLVFNMDIKTAKIDIRGILKTLAAKSIIREVSNIKRAIIYPNNQGEFILKTEGINISEVYKHDNLLNLNKLYSNDIHAIAKVYGIEAACRVIIKEVQNVFGVYGIRVDYRHLSLIADYMTYNGIFEPLSRKGMEASSSPLQQMSFESSLTFLKEAVIKGKVDSLQSTSSCLMLGQPCKGGTGSFSLLNTYDLKTC